MSATTHSFPSDVATMPCGAVIAPSSMTSASACALRSITRILLLGFLLLP